MIITEHDNKRDYFNRVRLYIAKNIYLKEGVI